MGDTIFFAVVFIFDSNIVYGLHAIVNDVEFDVVDGVNRQFRVHFHVSDANIVLRFGAIVAASHHSLYAEFASVTISAHVSKELPAIALSAIVVYIHTHTLRVELEFAAFHTEHSAVRHTDISDIYASERVGQFERSVEFHVIPSVRNHFKFLFIKVSL